LFWAVCLLISLHSETQDLVKAWKHLNREIWWTGPVYRDETTKLSDY